MKKSFFFLLHHPTRTCTLVHICKYALADGQIAQQSRRHKSTVTVFKPGGEVLKRCRAEKHIAGIIVLSTGCVHITAQNISLCMCTSWKILLEQAVPYVCESV